MIQFFVKNRELLLPDDFSFNWNEQNPEITTNGEFSLDMTVSLLEAQNAIAFEFLNRLNITTITKTADARLIIDGVVHSGTIIISKNTDIEVPFQFIAGNSELKYIAKNEKKIWELDFGTIPTPIDYTRALNSITTPSYTNGFVCTPVLVGDEILNHYTLDIQANSYVINGIDGKIIMQPYLLYFVNKLPELLGYKLGENAMNLDERAKQEYLINTVDSLKYADALPDMTVSDFITAIENGYNVSFVIDPKTRTCDIVRSSTNIATKKTILLTKVLDSYERTFDDNSNLSDRYKWTKISYPTNTSNWYKYQQLTEDFLLKCEIKEYASYTLLRNHIIATADIGNKLIIYRDLSTMNDYFVRNYRDGLTTVSEFFIDEITWAVDSRTGGYDICLINKMKSSGTSDDKIMTLDIVPASMAVKKHTVTYALSGGGSEGFECVYQLPVASNSYYLPITAEFIATIEASKDIPRSSQLEVSLFTGKIGMYVTARSLSNILTIPYPFSHVDDSPEFNCKLDNSHTWLQTVYKIWAVTTLKLNHIVKDYYNTTVLDTSMGYAFTVVDNPDITVNNLFIYNNRKYMPISFEREKSNKQKIVLGKFYRMLD
jgi:hypothetical protein